MSPNDIRPSADNLKIECLLNPGVFRFNNKICMLLRVAERPVQEEGFISFPIYKNKNGLSIMKLKIDDPNLNINDARVIEYKGENYLTTRSHLQIVFSDDGINSRTVDMHIKSIRSKIGDEHKSIIVSIYGSGYKIE